MEWMAFLSQPITQAGGILGLLALLHKSGVVDVKAIVRSAVGIDSGVRDVNADSRNVMQTVLLKVEELARYANHDTTENIARVEKGIEKLSDKMESNARTNDKVVMLLEDIKDNGIKCRKE